MTYSKCRFSKFKKSVARSVFGELQLTQMSLNFSGCNLKSRGLGAKLCVALLLFHFERNYDVLKWKSPCFSLNKNINFDKDETESKMENPTHSFREMKLVLISELRIKSKTAMSCSSRKKKRVHFSKRGKFFNICVLSENIVY